MVLRRLITCAWCRIDQTHPVLPALGQRRRHVDSQARRPRPVSGTEHGDHPPRPPASSEAHAKRRGSGAPPCSRRHGRDRRPPPAHQPAVPHATQQPGTLAARRAHPRPGALPAPIGQDAPPTASQQRAPAPPPTRCCQRRDTGAGHPHRPAPAHPGRAPLPAGRQLPCLPRRSPSHHTACRPPTHSDARTSARAAAARSTRIPVETRSIEAGLRATVANSPVIGAGMSGAGSAIRLVTDRARPAGLRPPPTLPCSALPSTWHWCCPA